MNTKNNDFTDFIKHIRKVLSISQEDLAHAVGVSFATISRWENGKSTPSKLAKRQFISFCEQKNIDTDYNRVEVVK